MPINEEAAPPPPREEAEETRELPAPPAADEFEKYMPKEKVEVGMDLADEAAPGIDFRSLGRFEGEPIGFPNIKYFDFDHGSNVQRMSWILLSHAEPGIEHVDKDGNVSLVMPPEHERVVDTLFHQRALYLASYLHFLGRTQLFGEKDAQEVERSVAMVKAVFAHYRGQRRAGDNQEILWPKQEGLEELVVDLVANYQKPKTLLQEILHDAVLFQEPRFRPNTRRSLDNLTKKWKNFKTPTGKDGSHQKGYMRHFGWKVG